RPIDNTKPWDKIFRDSVERIYYETHFYYDSAVLPLNRLKEIGRAMTRFRDFSRKEDLGVLYWLFIGLRVYLLLFFICLIIVWQQGKLKRVLRKFLIPCLVIGGVM